MPAMLKLWVASRGFFMYKLVGLNGFEYGQTDDIMGAQSDDIIVMGDNELLVLWKRINGREVTVYVQALD